MNKHTLWLDHYDFIVKKYDSFRDCFAEVAIYKFDDENEAIDFAKRLLATDVGYEVQLLQINKLFGWEE